MDLVRLVVVGTTLGAQQVPILVKGSIKTIVAVWVAPFPIHIKPSFPEPSDVFQKAAATKRRSSALKVPPQFRRRSVPQRWSKANANPIVGALPSLPHTPPRHYWRQLLHAQRWLKSVLLLMACFFWQYCSRVSCAIWMMISKGLAVTRLVPHRSRGRRDR